MTDLTKAPAKKGNMGRAWAIVVVVFLAGFCMPANMGKTMWLAPMVMEQFGIGEGVLGWLNGVFYILGALIAFPAASFVRKLGIRASVTIALCCGIIGNFIGAFAASVPALMISRVVEGAGFGLMGVIGVTAITPWFPREKRGLPLGIWGMWVSIANAVTPMLDSAVAGATGSSSSVWWMFFVIDIVVLVLFWLVYRVPSDPYIDEAEKKGEVKFSYKELLKQRVVWILAFVFFCEEGAFIACQGFFSAYVTTELQAPLMIGSIIVTAGAIWGSIFSPIAGKISDSIKSRYKVLIFCMVSAVIFGILVFWVRDLKLFVIVVILNGFTGGGVAAMLWTSASDVVPSHLISGATAALACAQSIGMFLGSTFMGNIIEAVGYTHAGWFFLAPCFLVSLFVIIFGLRGKLK
jgi:MFS family permease